MSEKNIKVSVIFPIYNNEKYLENCIRSVMNQTLKEIELILIDDGSTDSAPEICDKLANEDTRIKVIHKKNEGSAAGRNQGIENASGEYIAFVESDDYVATDMYEMLYKRAVELDADIVKCGFYMCEDGRKSEARFFYDVAGDGEVFSLKDKPKLISNHASMWAGIYKRSFINSHNIRCIVTPSATYSDFSWMAQTYAYAERITIYHKPFYYYNFENPGSSWRQAGEKVFYKVYHCGEANKILKENNIFDLVREELGYHEFRTCLGHARNIKIELREEYFKRYSALMNDILYAPYQYKYFSRSERKMAERLMANEFRKFYKMIDFQYKRRNFADSLEKNKLIGSFVKSFRQKKRAKIRKIG